MLKTNISAVNEMALHYPQTWFDARYIPEPNSGCWIWTAALDSKGYGLAWLFRRCLKAHRLSWVMHNRPLKEGEYVLHKCDNRSCVNPDHLFVGSLADNARDCRDKGRSAIRRGIACNTAKLTPEKVLEIRRSPLNSCQLARKFGVRHSSIWNIRHGRSWKHLQDGDCK